MTRKKKPDKKSQFVICAKKVDFEQRKPKAKSVIKQFTSAEKIEFEAHRKETESTWSKIDRATIDKDSEFVESWDE